MMRQNTNKSYKQKITVEIARGPWYKQGGHIVPEVPVSEILCVVTFDYSTVIQLWSSGEWGDRYLTTPYSTYLGVIAPNFSGLVSRIYLSTRLYLRWDIWYMSMEFIVP